MTLRIALVILLIVLLPKTTFALTSDWQGDTNVRVRLISGLDGTNNQSIIPLGLDVELADTWHTYWRSPGMAGLPPQLDWQSSQTPDGNLKDARLFFPAPKRYTAYGLETVGYRDHVVFPIEAVLQKPGQALRIKTTLNLLICSSICVPKTFTLELTVPDTAAQKGAEASLLQNYQDQVPSDGENSGLLIKKIIFDGTGLLLTIESRQPLEHPDMFVESDDGLSFKAPTLTMAADRHSATLRVVPSDPLPEGSSLSRKPVTLTITDGASALERHIVIPSVNAEPPTLAPPPLPLSIAIVLALLGGFILNLMPCVLPVLSLKVLSVIGHGGGETVRVRQSFFVTATGILFSFVVLGCGTLAFKAMGYAFGWGIQFQQPLFLVFLILLLTFFAANLWGLFEIRLPQFLADGLADTSYHPKLAGDFATGAFATLLATPCSAPFLGTAIGFALASGPPEILIIFFCLGLGMALPYLIIALFPRLAVSLPKPGAWMVTLRHVLGGALALTAIWFLWVLAAQITPRFAALAGLSMTAMIICLGLAKHQRRPWILWTGLAILTSLTFGLAWGGAHLPRKIPLVDQLWQPFSENILAADLAEGKTVFLDITADWCLTCKANKQITLSNEDIKERLFHSNIVAMQADWTNPDPTITAFLQKYGRYGIPFNAVFGPGAPEGLVLPELLTPSLVKEALDKASQSSKTSP